jgi:hypothetical protein
VTTFTVSGSADLLGDAERAVQHQVAYDFRRYWPGGGIRFGPGGIPVIIESDAAIQRDCGGPAGGCHTIRIVNEQSQGPIIYLNQRYSQNGDVSLILGHEILETLDDPDVQTGSTEHPNLLLEVCDPVVDSGYVINGMMVPDFITPAWFSDNASGPYDFMHISNLKPQKVVGDGYLNG